MKRQFRPTLWASICTVVALVILLALGTWQVQRGQWKAGEIARLEAQIAAPEMPLTADLLADPDAEYRRVTVTAPHASTERLFLFGKKQANTPGYHVLELLVLNDSRRVLIVNRGWVDEAWREAQPRVLTRNIPSFTGVLTRLPRKGALSAVNPDAGPLLRIDIDDIAARSGLDADQFAPLMLVVTKATGSAPPPYPQEVKIALPDNHWHYALTWFSLALALAVIYVTYHLKPIDET